MTVRLEAGEEAWPIAGRFVISRGSKTEAKVVVVTLRSGDAAGRGECVPYARYGESVESVLAQIEGARDLVESGAGRDRLQDRLPPGAARNALDCALWDLEAKQTGVRVWTRLGRPRLSPLKTAYTVSYGTPEEMGAAAAAAARRPLLKLKIGGLDDLDRVEAVRAAAPKSRLIVDGNEGLTFDQLQQSAPELARLGVQLVEQPLKAGEDQALEGWSSPVPLCADESLHSRSELDRCAGRYAVLNVKLDKTGGLTEAAALVEAARARGLGVMVGCMVATSLSMAPAMVIAQGAEFVDLDGPLLLARDREPGLRYVGSVVEPPSPDVWG